MIYAFPSNFMILSFGGWPMISQFIWMICVATSPAWAVSEWKMGRTFQVGEFVLNYPGFSGYRTNIISIMQFCKDVTGYISPNMMFGFVPFRSIWWGRWCWNGGCFEKTKPYSLATCWGWCRNAGSMQAQEVVKCCCHLKGTWHVGYVAVNRCWYKHSHWQGFEARKNHGFHRVKVIFSAGTTRSFSYSFRGHLKITQNWSSPWRKTSETHVFGALGVPSFERSSFCGESWIFSGFWIRISMVLSSNSKLVPMVP